MLHPQVEYLQTCEQPAQRSPEWYTARYERLTASDVATGLTITERDLELAAQHVFHLQIKQKVIGGNCNPYSSLVSLIRKKCQPDSFRGNMYTRWGQKYEPVATELYELRNQTKVHEFGLLLHPKYNIGASPDGITQDGTMLEIKCPSTREITGIPPNYYWIQMQVQMEVCDLDVCDFLECTFTEYNDKEAYLNDTETPDNEKGVIIVNIEEDSAKFEYLPIGSGQLPKDDETRPVCYWKLKDYSCVPVKRDRQWFTDSLPMLQDVWKKIEYYREIGAEHIPKYSRDIVLGSNNDVSMSHIAYTPKLQKISAYDMFQSDSEDDDDCV